jgi:MoaA/NifB/PqqE/SkfB family radical SAM enzyme
MALTEKRPARRGRWSGFRSIALPLRLVGDFARFHYLRPWPARPKPLALCLYVTYRCNLRCTMCGIWKHRDSGPELTLAEFDRVLSDPLFAGLEFININGGEPNLRRDLPEIADMLSRRFPRLRALSLNTNGLPPAKTAANVRSIARTCQTKGIDFSVSISLHGPGRIHDEMVGTRNAFPRVVETLERLKELQASLPFYLGVNCVITQANADRLEDLHRWCRERALPINYTLGEVRGRFYNQGRRRTVEVEGGRRDRVIEFLRARAAERSPRNHHALRYQVLADMLEHDACRSLSCHYSLGGAILGARGQLYYCKQSGQVGDCRKEPASEVYFRPSNQLYRKHDLLERVCPHCLPNTFNRFELGYDAVRYVRFLTGTSVPVPSGKMRPVISRMPEKER